MAANRNHSDGIQSLVRALGEALYNDPGEKPMPMSTTDAEEAIRAQLTENTGTHFLDSGFDSGRHWQQNEETPPWERPEWDVGDGYVTHNVYHHMSEVFERDRDCVALESALYAWGNSGDRKRDSWLTTMEDFAAMVLENDPVLGDGLRDIGVPAEFAEDVAGVAHEVSPDRHDRHGRQNTADPYTVNTYNGEHHSLTQVLQGTCVGGPYAEYVFLQVHQGADVRGGYTGPRVYKSPAGWIPWELQFKCHNCGWQDAESCIWNDEHLLYQTSVDPFELEDEGLVGPDSPVDGDHPAVTQAYQNESDGHHSGAVFHKCHDGEELGYVTYR